MKRYLLDTTALLTLRDNETGAETVAALLQEARLGKVRCFGCFITLMELFYRVWKDEGEHEGRLAYKQCQTLQINWIHENSHLLEKASQIKAEYPLSLADAWIGACAILNDAVLVHKDPELKSLNCEQLLLPLKSRSVTKT